MPNRVKIKQKESPDLIAEIMSLVEHMDHAQRDEILYGIKQLESGNEARSLLEALRNMRLPGAVEYLRNNPPSAEIVMFLVVWATNLSEKQRQKIESEMRADIARNAADERHSQHHGYREKKKVIQEIWANGMYKTRNDCAQKEMTTLGVSFKTARITYLTGTPDPDPWPARPKRKNKSSSAV